MELRFILAETRRKGASFVDNIRFINDVCRTYHMPFKNS